MAVHITFYVFLTYILFTGVPLIGCYSHKLNLAVSGVVGKEEKKNKEGDIIQAASSTRAAVEKLDKLMGSLKTLKNSALLRPLTKLRPERKNATRWYSLFHMLVKWKRIRSFVLQIDGFPEATTNLIPTPTEQAYLSTLLQVLQDFESVSQALQRGGDKTLNLYESRRLFDRLIEKYGTRFELSQLQHDSSLVCSAAFENGIIKIQRGLDNHNKLNNGEKNAVSRYLCVSGGDDNDENNSEEEALGFADSALADAHREKRRKVDSRNNYVATGHVLSQSNLCERLFSLAKLVLSDRRQSMHPSTLNNLLLLKTNRHLWSVVDIQTVIGEANHSDGEPDIELSDDEEDAGAVDESDGEDGDEMEA